MKRVREARRIESESHYHELKSKKVMKNGTSTIVGAGNSAVNRDQQKHLLCPTHESRHLPLPPPPPPRHHQEQHYIHQQDAYKQMETPLASSRDEHHTFAHYEEDHNQQPQQGHGDTDDRFKCNLWYSTQSV